MFWGRFLVQCQFLDLDFIMPLRLETAEAHFVEMSLLTRSGWLSRRLWMTLVRFDPVYVVYFKVRFDHLHNR